MTPAIAMDHQRQDPPPSRSIPGLGMIVMLCLIGAYAGTVAVLDWSYSLRGWRDLALERHIGLISYLGVTALGNPEVIWFCAVVVGLSLWRFQRRGQLDAVAALPLLAFAVIVLSVGYGHHVRKARPAQHAAAMRKAIEQGERKRLRELALACDWFCGFERDSGPLVWLLSQADSDADINAIGWMLRRNAVRSDVSHWLEDRRTPLEVAVDRYGSDPSLLSYLLGFDNNGRHFEVSRAPSTDRDAALIYAVRQRAALPLIRKLLRAGANPTVAWNGTTAVDTAKRVAYPEALEEMRAVYGGIG